MNQWLITAALFCALSLPFAANADTPMELMIVTPTRMPQPLDKTIADTTVLDEQDIRKSGAPDVPTLLRSLAGVEIVQTGGLGSLSSTFMRGTNSDHVLVLLDGVRINSATAGTTALEHIMLDSIERIEVVRGNVSSLYGSDAIGGVIQLFTKQGYGAPTFNASAGLGNQGTQRVSAGYSGVVNDTSFSLNAGRVQTDGVSAMNPQLAPGANPNNNGYDNDTFNAQVKHVLNADHALSATLFGTRGNISFDNAFGSPTDINNSIENIGKFSVASDDQLSKIWHSQVRLAQGIDDIHSYLNGTLNSRFKTQSNQFVWQNNFKIADGQQLTLAAEYLGQAVASDTLYTQTTRNEKSVWGGYTGIYGAQQVQLNLRQDSYSDFGKANTVLLGYGVSFADSWRVTASISSAFKAPTFNDLYYPGYANPNLQPEHSQNREVGIHFAANGQHIDAVYFDNHIRNLITLDASYIPYNVDQAQITGQELSYEGDFDTSHLKANVTFQNPRDSTTGLVLLRRAKEFASVVADHDFDALNVGAEVRQSGVRQDSNSNTNPATPVTLAGYSLLNLTSRYNIDKHLSLMATLGNVFNRNYSEVYSYNTLGRTLFIGLNYQQ